MTGFDLSIVIPTLDEEGNLSRLLQHLDAQSGLSLDVIVADGGSGDGTLAVATKAGARICNAGRGRGRQMNAGAQLARADDLLFLHADSSLLEAGLLAGGLEALRAARATAGHDSIAGHFALRFVRKDDAAAFAYRYYEAKTHLNRVNTTNGDQGFLLSARFFHDLGGFSEELPFLEDQRLAETIRERGSWMTLPGHVHTSARRFEEEGMARRMILSAITMALHSSTFPEFFESAPALYRSQSHTKRLELGKFLGFIHGTLRTKPFRERFGRWEGAGKYVRQNTWQLFFVVDVALRSIWPNKRHVMTRFHDFFVHPIMANRLFDVLTAGVVWTWFQITRAYFAVVDRRGSARAG